MPEIKSWVVVRVRPQYLVRAELNVRNQGAEFYAPRALVYSPRARQYKQAALFPGYAFVRRPDGAWVFLRGTVGILDVLMSLGESPAWLPHAEVEKIRAREGPDGLVRLLATEFQVGERVRVEKGPVSLDAIVDGMAGRDRVWVLLHVLGRWSRTEVDVKDVSR